MNYEHDLENLLVVCWVLTSKALWVGFLASTRPWLRKLSLSDANRVDLELSDFFRKVLDKVLFFIIQKKFAHVSRRPKPFLFNLQRDSRVDASVGLSRDRQGDNLFRP